MLFTDRALGPRAKAYPLIWSGYHCLYALAITKTATQDEICTLQCGVVILRIRL